MESARGRKSIRPASGPDRRRRGERGLGREPERRGWVLKVEADRERRGCSPPAWGARGLRERGARPGTAGSRALRWPFGGEPNGLRPGGGEPTDRGSVAGCGDRRPPPAVPPSAAQRGPEPAARRAEWGGVPRRIAGAWARGWRRARAGAEGAHPRPWSVRRSAPPPWACGAFWRVRVFRRVGGWETGGAHGRGQGGAGKCFPDLRG